MVDPFISDDMKNTLFAKLSPYLSGRPKPPCTKWHKRRPRAICRLWLDKLLKRPLSKTLAPSSGNVSATTPNVLAILQQDSLRGVGLLSVCQTRLKSGAPSLSYKQTRSQAVARIADRTAKNCRGRIT